MTDFNESFALTDFFTPRRFEDGSELPALATVFEDGSFLCSTDASCRAASRLSRKIERLTEQGRTRRLSRLFDELTGL